jgi:hypothetical protein
MTYVGVPALGRTYISVVVATMLTAAADPNLACASKSTASLRKRPSAPKSTTCAWTAYPTRTGARVLDLPQQDFEILESGVPQKIEQFERVLIRPAGPQDSRIEPNTVAESRSMAQNPRARLFVLFLDTYHVDVAGSHRIRAR